MEASPDAEIMDVNVDVDLDDEDAVIVETAGNDTIYPFGQPHHGEDYKRTHHNQLERRRRENIKTSFGSLKELIPGLSQIDKTSRAIILRRATEHIRTLKFKNQKQKDDISQMRDTNQQLDNEFLALEKIKSVHRYTKIKQISAPSEMENFMNPLKTPKQKSSSKYTVDTLAEACATTIGEPDVEQLESPEPEETQTDVAEPTEEIITASDILDITIVNSQSLQ